MTHFMIQNMVMIKINIHEAKTHLSRYLDHLKRGEVILLCKRNIPIAEIRALPAARQRKRPVGVAKGEFKVPPSFFKPLPADLLKAFAGKAK